jgi:hypothetical protein
MTGIPSGRLSALPGLGIDTRRTGYDFRCLHCLGWIRSTMISRCVGETAFTPSTPAVFLPWLSCVTRRTASRRAARDFISSFWSVWTARVLPRWLARKILFCMRYTCCSSLRQDNLRQLSLAASSGVLLPGAFVSAIRLVALSSRSPCRRQPIPWLSQRRSLFRQSCSHGYAGGSLLVVSTSNENTRESSPVPTLRFTLP